MSVSKQKEIIPEKISENFERRIISLDKLMVVVCDFTNGPALQPDPPHSHIHEQICYVAEGDLFFYIGEEKHQLCTGDLIAVPSGVLHCIQIISKHVRIIDSFSPVRQDFLEINENF
jgi:quercetin dioxygenase-like cupin family protein